jgi:HK97 family phage major capsid protein
MKKYMPFIALPMVHVAMLMTPRADLSPILAEVQKLGQTFNEFKEKNDLALKEMKDKGSVDPVLKEQVDRINNSITEISGKVDEHIKTQKREQERVDKLELNANRSGLDGGKKGGDDIKTQAEKFYSAHARRNGGRFDPANVDVEGFKNYLQAKDKYIREGESALSNDMRNALSTGSDKDGGFLVSPERSTEVIDRLFDTSPIRQYARQVTISKDKIVLPKRVGKMANGGYGSETTEPSKTAAAEVGEQTIEVHRLWAQPEVTQDFLDDADINVEAWLQEDAIESFSLTENEKFVNGTGVKQPRGFMSYTDDTVTTADKTRAWGKVQYVKTGGAGAFAASGAGADALIEIIHSMKAAHRQNAVWAANRATIAAVRKLKDGDGNYLWAMGNIKEGTPSTLLGYETAEFEDMADIAVDSFAMAFANFQSAYLIVDRKGLTLLRDPLTKKPYVKFYYYMRNGGDIRDFDAIKYLKFSS